MIYLEKTKDDMLRKLLEAEIEECEHSLRHGLYCLPLIMKALPNYKTENFYSMGVSRFTSAWERLLSDLQAIKREERRLQHLKDLLNSL